MNLEESMAFADRVVFERTGKHLDDLQAGLIQGVLQRKKYSEIAKAHHCTEGHVRDVGYELWTLLSDALGEEVNKSNLVSTLIRQSVVTNPVVGNVGTGNVIGTVHFCTQPEESPEFIRGKQQAKLEAVKRLRQLGLSDAQIAEVLELSLEEIQQDDR
jgi:hypothetical protein